MRQDGLTPKIERLIAMAERLTEALEADMEALKRGKPAEMRTIDPEIQTLSAVYGREAADLGPALAKAAAGELRQKLVATTQRFVEALARHTRLLTRVKNASEGMIRAVAEEVERRRAPTRVYGARPSQARPLASAMIYNKVV